MKGEFEMATPAQVTWATSSASSEAGIEKLGGVIKRLFGKANWGLKPDDAIAMIEQDEWRFFIEFEDEKVWLEVEETEDGLKRLGLSCDTDPDAVFGSLPDTPDQ